MLSAISANLTSQAREGTGNPPSSTKRKRKRGVSETASSGTVANEKEREFLEKIRAIEEGGTKKKRKASQPASVFTSQVHDTSVSGQATDDGVSEERFNRDVAASDREARREGEIEGQLQAPYQDLPLKPLKADKGAILGSRLAFPLCPVQDVVAVPGMFAFLPVMIRDRVCGELHGMLNKLLIPLRPNEMNGDFIPARKNYFRFVLYQQHAMGETLISKDVSRQSMVEKALKAWSKQGDVLGKQFVRLWCFLLQWSLFATFEFYADRLTDPEIRAPKWVADKLRDRVYGVGRNDGLLHLYFNSENGCEAVKRKMRTDENVSPFRQLLEGRWPAADASLDEPLQYHPRWNVDDIQDDDEIFRRVPAMPIMRPCPSLGGYVLGPAVFDVATHEEVTPPY